MTTCQRVLESWTWVVALGDSHSGAWTTDARSSWWTPTFAASGRRFKHAGGRPGRLDVHWTTGERLPAIAPVDVVIAAEVLCYVPDPAAVVAAVRPLLKPGGMLLASVEARYGWAMGPDVAEGSLDALFGDGIVHVDQDRWVRTFDEDDFEGCSQTSRSATLRRATMC